MQNPAKKDQAAQAEAGASGALQPSAAAGWLDEGAAPGEMVPVSDHAVVPVSEDDAPAQLVVSGPGLDPAPAPPAPGLPNPSLEVALFDGELPELPAPPIAPPPPPPQEARPWPGDVLGQEEALRVLTGVGESEPNLRELTKGLFASLSEVESSALWGHPLPFDAEPLRNAILMRYRLSVAVALKPAAGQSVDNGAMDDLVAATDLVLSTLGPPAGADEAVLKAFDATRAAVARDAVAIAEVAKNAVAAVAHAAAQEATQKYARVQEKAARIRSYQVVSAARAKPRMRALPVMFGVMIAAGALFHGGRLFLSRERPPPPPLPGMPASTVGFRDAKTNVAVVIPRQGKALDADAVREIKRKAAADGKGVQQLGPDHLLVVPAEMVPPAEVQVPGMEVPHGPP